MFLPKRPRRLRQNASIRAMVGETHFSVAQLIQPVFICAGKSVEKSHPALPGCKTLSPDRAVAYAKEAYEAGLRCLLLFGVSDKKDARGSEALNPDSSLIHAIKDIRSKVPDLILASDIALDPYTDHGHDGLYESGKILNDATVEVLCEMSTLQAKAGVQIIAPSDMMDGRIGAVRRALDSNGFEDSLILAYTAKYASAFYGPFRDTLQSHVQGDKKSYQMNPQNRREALKELLLDVEEGADIVMVKPATLYLDIIREFADQCQVPVAAYHVSGECALLEAGAQAKLIDRERAIQESFDAIFRSGAQLIASYFALEWAKNKSK